jgi:hypothetical protein
MTIPKSGDLFAVQIGMEVGSTLKTNRRIAKRKSNVLIHHVIEFPDYYEVNWAGSAGYWCWVKVPKQNAIEGK